VIMSSLLRNAIAYQGHWTTTRFGTCAAAHSEVFWMKKRLRAFLIGSEVRSWLYPNRLQICIVAESAAAIPKVIPTESKRLWQTTGSVAKSRVQKQSTEPAYTASFQRYSPGGTLLIPTGHSRSTKTSGPC
jgi:hypothetical protein